MTGPADRWKLDVRPRMQRQLTRLPEKLAAAAAEFITGPLLDNPRCVGHPIIGACPRAAVRMWGVCPTIREPRPVRGWSGFF